MTPEAIQKKILSLHWERWLERPFKTFLFSVVCAGVSRASFRRLGIDAEYSLALFQEGAWFRSLEVHRALKNQLKKYLKTGETIFDMSTACERFYRKQRPVLLKLASRSGDAQKILHELYPVLETVSTYIWLTHGLEDVYQERLLREVPKYVTGDVEKFIGDASFPTKKNAHALFEEALASGISPRAIVMRYAWIKARDGFSDGFTEAEIRTEQHARRNQRTAPTVQRPEVRIPAELALVIREARELVYWRTLRTDILYEFLYLARPVLQRVAATYGLTFPELRHYTIRDLMNGCPKNYSAMVTAAAYRGELAFYDFPIFKQAVHREQQIKGAIAYPGQIRGTAKIVKTADEIDKVKQGDILVAPITAPSFILGMQRAAAFVTDEGGLTCHAAIVAREMKKPCIIGTKIATKVFKDGDVVEVDANKGIVKKV